MAAEMAAHYCQPAPRQLTPELAYQFPHDACRQNDWHKIQRTRISRLPARSPQFPGQTANCLVSSRFYPPLTSNALLFCYVLPEIRRFLPAYYGLRSWPKLEKVLEPIISARSFCRERAHFDDFKIASFDAFERIEFFIVPARIGSAGHEPIASIVGDDHSVGLQTLQNNLRAGRIV